MDLMEHKNIILADTIDRLINLDFHCKGLVRLYEAFRETEGVPLVYQAARGIIERLSGSPRGQVVVIGTGFLIGPYHKPETDGVIAAPLLARALAMSFGVTPVILCEEDCLETLYRTATASELHVAEDLATAIKNDHSVCILPVSKNYEEAKAFSDSFLSETNCRFMISIEHAGANSEGVYHSALGEDVSYKIAKLDYLFSKISELGGYTVAIGDLGNELGLGNARELIQDLVPFGHECKCPCKGGTITSTCSDAPIIGMSSEVATYGLLAMLAAMREDRRLLCSAQLQRFVLAVAAMNGAVDGQDGRCSQTIDIMTADSIERLVALLHDVIDHADMHTKNRPEFLQYIASHESHLNVLR